MEFQCRVIVQRRCSSCCWSVEKHSAPSRTPFRQATKTVRLPTGIGVRLQTGMLFGITTESCSASQRNRVHLRPDSPTTSQEPYQVSGAFKSGARVWGDEAEVRLREAALSRTKEERQPVVCSVRPGEPVSVAEKTAASGPGLALPQPTLIAGPPPQRVSTQTKLDSNSRIGMTKYLLP